MREQQPKRLRVESPIHGDVAWREPIDTSKHQSSSRRTDAIRSTAQALTGTEPNILVRNAMSGSSGFRQQSLHVEPQNILRVLPKGREHVLVQLSLDYRGNLAGHDTLLIR